MEKSKKIWMNGSLVDWDEAKVHVLTHALHYGTAVFEGIRCYATVEGSAVFRLDEHMDRFFNSAKVYLMHIPYSREEIMDAVKLVVKANGLKECYIRPLAYYGYGKMGLNPEGVEVKVMIAVWPWGPYLGEEALRRGVRCKVSSWLRVDPRMMPPQAKCAGNYPNLVLAKVEAVRSGYDEAILLNTQGMVAEGAGENVFTVKNGALYTPPLSTGALRGITRDSVLKIARDIGISAGEENFTREDLYTSDEVFLTGTAAEITPVREVDERPVGAGPPYPLTEKLQKRFYDVVHGIDPKYHSWLYFID